jgi:uncharacterized membrane protein YdjX (TVP38/TMEM64 family)
MLLLFIAWFCTTAYLYFTGFDIRNFFAHIELTTVEKASVFLLLFSFRNYFLLPSTFLILATWFVLEDFYLTLLVSIAWVAIWITQTYFVGYLFAENLREKKEFALVKKYEEKIKRDGFKVIFFWSLVPTIPVDILYYTSGFVKFDFSKVFAAGFLGELPLVVAYSYLWIRIEAYMKYFSSIAVWLLLLLAAYFIVRKKFFSKTNPG